jgi:hypothetical protein
MSILIYATSVIDYVAKYCNKVETASKGLSHVLSGVVRNGQERGHDTMRVLRAAFNRLAGRRDKCSQETADLINSTPIVICSHSFVMINLKSLI